MVYFFSWAMPAPAAYPFARAEWPGAWWGLVGSREPGRFRELGVASFYLPHEEGFVL